MRGKGLFYAVLIFAYSCCAKINGDQKLMVLRYIKQKQNL